MTALLEWDDEEADAPLVTPRRRAPLRPGELPAAIQAAIWRGDQMGVPITRVVATGYAQLDAELPGGGWPGHGLTEVLQAQPTVFEWRLLSPAVCSVMAAGGEVVIIGPPKALHAAGLRQLGWDERRLVWIQAETPAERLWVTEQLVKANAAAAIVAWLPQARQEQIRRLQVCAQACDGPVFLCRPAAAEHEPSAAPLRVQVRPSADWGLAVHLLKRKGGAHVGQIELNAIPKNLTPLITPRLTAPSVLRAALRPRDQSSSHVLGSTSSRSATLRVPAQ